MNADKLLKYAGGFGTYQRRLACIIFVFSLIHAWESTVVIFTQYKPRYRCRMHDGEAENYTLGVSTLFIVFHCSVHIESRSVSAK